MTEGAATLPPSARDWLGHPRALVFLFLTGMWEVAALAGMRAILVFHLVRDVGLSTASAVEVFGISTAASFVMSFAGGVVADRFIGVGRAILAGAIIMAVGHLTLVWSTLLYPSLALIAIGSGLFRPTLIAQVWRLYADEDPRSSDALLRYKLGCNFGGIVGPLACGALFEWYGWTPAVLFCAGAMLVAAIVYRLSRRFLPAENRTQSGVSAKAAAPSISWSALLKFSPAALTALVLVFAGGCLHWAAANQQGGTLAIWTLNDVDRTIGLFGGAFVIPAGWFQTLNPILILAFAPVVSWVWLRARVVDPQVAETQRMIAGSAMLALSYAVLVVGVFASGDSQVHWIWLVLSTAPLTLGELYLDSMGQAYFCRQAPKGFLSTFLSLWLVTSTVGYIAAAWIAQLWDQVTTPVFFGACAAVALASCAVIALSGSFRIRHATP